MGSSAVRPPSPTFVPLESTYAQLFDHSAVMACVAPSRAGRLRVPAVPRRRSALHDHAGGACRRLSCVAGALIIALVCPALCEAAPAAPLPVDVAAGYGALEDVACPLTSQCTAVGFYGNVFTFDPAAIVIPRLGAASREDDIEVVCPSASQCSSPSEPTGISTFDPTALPTEPSTTLDLRSLDPSPVAQIACASPALCVTVALTKDVVAFDPRSAAGLQETAHRRFDRQTPTLPKLEPVAVGSALIPVVLFTQSRVSLSDDRRANVATEVRSVDDRQVS